LRITTVREQDSNFNYHSWPNGKKRKPTCNRLWITISISCGYQIKRLVWRRDPLTKYLCLQFIPFKGIFIGGHTQLPARFPGLVVYSKVMLWEFFKQILHGTRVEKLKVSTGVSFTRRHVNVTEHDVTHDWNKFQLHLTQSNTYNDVQISQVVAVLTLYITTTIMFFRVLRHCGKKN